MVNRKKRYLIDARFILQCTHDSFVGSRLLTVGDRDNTFTFGSARDLLRLRQTLGMDTGVLVIGKDAWSITSEQNINDLVAFLDDLKFPYVNDPTIATLNIVNSLCSQFSHILTEDKRFIQLSHDQLAIVLSDKRSPGHYKFLLPESSRTEVGVDLAMVPTYLSLISGPKRTGLTHRQAIRVIEVCGDVSAIYEHLAQIPSSAIRKKLIDNEREVKRFYLESTIDLSVESPPHQIMHSASKINTKRGRQVLRKYGFYSLLAFLSDAPKVQVASTQSNRRSESYTAVINRKSMEELEAQIRSVGLCSIDTESDDKDPRNGTPFGVSFCLQEGRAYFVPLIETDLNDVSKDDVLRFLKRILQSDVEFIGHNIKYDYVLLKKSKIKIKSLHFDTMLSAYDCHGDCDSFSLKHLARTLLGCQITSYRDIVDEGSTFLDLPFDEIVLHACQDADMTFRLYHVLLGELKARELEKQYFTDTIPCLKQVCDLECDGVSVDKQKLNKVRETLLKKAVHLKDEVSSRVGNMGDLDSQRDLSEILTDILDLRRFAGVKNISLRLLEQAAITEPTVRLIVQYKRVRKQIKAVEAISASVVRGRVFPVFSLTRSLAGLISTSKPNLFDIGRVHELKTCFDNKVQDYFRDTNRSLDILAYVTKDSVLKRVRRTKSKVDSIMAKHPLMCEYDQDDLLLSLVVGFSDSELSRRLSADQLTVSTIRHDVEKRYMTLFKWIRDFRSEALKKGYAEVAGRRKYIDGLRSSNIAKRKLAENHVVRWMMRL